jgi:nucleoid DNA-binding protein
MASKNSKAPTKKPMTKSAFVGEIAEKLGTSKASIEQTLSAIADIVRGELGPKGPGVVVLPGLLRLKAVHKAATPARDGVNPFTKQPIKIAAKPASTKVKATPVKALKDGVQ